MQFDAVLIEQSLAKQYGILPSAQNELHYSDWAKLVGGLMDDTPLGRVIAVRSETDRGVIRQMSPAQRQLRAEWAAFQAKREMKKTKEQLRREIGQLEKMLARAFGGDG